MDKLSIEGKEGVIDDNTVTFEREVGEALNVDEIFVIRLQIPTGVTNNRNVIAVNDSGDQMWRIPEGTKTSFADNPYVSIYEERGELWARTWTDWAFESIPKVARSSTAGTLDE